MKNTLRFLSLLIAAFGLAAGVRAAPVATIRNLNTAYAGESNAAYRNQLPSWSACFAKFAQVAKPFRAEALSNFRRIR